MAEDPAQASATLPASDEMEIALSLLGESVASLSGNLQRPPTASEVRIDLKQRTYDGFSPRRLGFKRFRDFLAMGQERGVVVVDDSRPGDVSVTTSLQEIETEQPPMVRRDLWKAVTDWNAGVQHFIDLEENRVVKFPRDPRPLEPEELGAIRLEVAANRDRYLAVPSLGWARQSAIMRDFVQTGLVTAPSRSVLLAALEQEKPARAWQAVIRLDPSLSAAWNRFFSSHVYQHLVDWREKSPAADKIQIERLHSTEAIDSTLESETGGQHATVPDFNEIWRILTSSTNAAVGRTDENRGPSSHEVRLGQESQLRRAVKDAIDRMPIDEVKRLSIPVGYLFTE